MSANDLATNQKFSNAVNNGEYTVPLAILLHFAINSLS